jgi:hypothetical protein
VKVLWVILRNLGGQFRIGAMKMEHKKVLILIAADGTGYQDLVKAIREIWGSSNE